MMKQKDGPIIYIEDDEDNQFLFGQAIKELALSNETRFFFSGAEALTYLKATNETPLLILSDLNMPGMNGIELHQEISADDYLRQKSIPFIFYTMEVSPSQIKELYQGTIQGLYIKPLEFADLKQQIVMIVSYWKTCLHPDTV